MRLNAEALHAIQDTQERIARTLDRADRSEAVLQSTQALNDTFRGVRVAQQALVDRLEKEERRPWRAAAAAAALVLLAGGGALWFFLGREDDLRARIEGLRAEVGGPDRRAFEERSAAIEQELRGRVEALSRKSSLTETEKAAAEKELGSLRGELESARRENEALFAGREEALRLSRENAALREDAVRLRAEREAAETRAGAAERRIDEAEERARGAAARAAAASGAATASAQAPAGGPSPAPAPGAGPAEVGGPPAARAKEPAPPERAAVPPNAVTDTAQVRRLLDPLNGLLEKAAGQETWRIVSAGAVEGQRLLQVALEARRADGTVLKSFQAGECRLVLLPRSRLLEFRLRDGSITFLGARTVAFLDGRYTTRLTVDPTPFQAAGSPLLAEE